MENLGTQSRGGNELIDVDAALGFEFPPITTSYDERDLSLYALGVGAARDPLNPKELRFVYENHGDGFQALPSYARGPRGERRAQAGGRGQAGPRAELRAGSRAARRAVHGAAAAAAAAREAAPPGEDQGHLRQGQERAGRHRHPHLQRGHGRGAGAQRDDHLRARRGRVGRRARALERRQRAAGARSGRRGDGEDPGEPGAACTGCPATGTRCTPIPSSRARSASPSRSSTACAPSATWCGTCSSPSGTATRATSRASRSASPSPSSRARRCRPRCGRSPTRASSSAARCCERDKVVISNAAIELHTELPTERPHAAPAPKAEAQAPAAAAPAAVQGRWQRGRVRRHRPLRAEAPGAGGQGGQRLPLQAHPARERLDAGSQERAGQCGAGRGGQG